MSMQGALACLAQIGSRSTPLLLFPNFAAQLPEKTLQLRTGSSGSIFLKDKEKYKRKSPAPAGLCLWTALL
jgi:hypothetical protein